MSHSPGIFLEDFDRSEFTDNIQAIIGRSLILATRFDSKCLELRRATHIEEAIHSFEPPDVEALSKFVSDLYSNDMNLFNTIKSFGFSVDFNEVLHKARLARNDIAHNLCRDLTGCIESKELTGADDLVDNISRLSKDMIEGDALVSMIISIVLKEPLPRYEYIDSYKRQLLEWVIETYE